MGIYIPLKLVQIKFYLQTKICVLRTQQILKFNLFQGRNKPKKLQFPILHCRAGQMFSSVFWNLNTHISKMFYSNNSESQSY